MDENRFDDLIKGEVGEYEPKGFDPSALASLHQQMASSFTLPWHVLYRSELISAASVVILATVIVWSQWFFASQSTNTLHAEIASLQSQNSTLDELQKQFQLLADSKSDTIRILQVSERTAETTYLIEEIMALKSALARQKNHQMDSDMIFLGSKQQLPRHIIQLLERQGFILQQDDEVYLVAAYPDAPSLHRVEADSEFFLTTSIYPYSPFEDDPESVSNKSNSISAANRRKLARHYWKGLGLEIGPALQIGKAGYEQGTTRPYAGLGFMADLILSPSLSLETGAVYSSKHLELKSSNIRNLDLDLPQVNTDLGPLSSAELDASIIEIPMGLKYRTPLNNKYLSVGLGYSAFLYLNEEFEYTHQNAQISGNVISIQRSNSPHIYSGTMNASLGIQHLLHKGGKLETSLFYQKGIGGLGVEKLQADFFGAKAIYWIRMK